MLRQFPSDPQIPALLFGTVLLGSVLGMGAFFDRLVEQDEVRQVARWAGSHLRVPAGQAVVDRSHSRLFAFDSSGRLRASTKVLLKMVPDERLQGIANTPADQLSPADAGGVPPEFFQHLHQRSVTYVVPDEPLARDRRPL